MRLLAYWRGAGAVALNADWSAETAPVEQVRGAGASLVCCAWLRWLPAAAGCSLLRSVAGGGWCIREWPARL